MRNALAIGSLLAAGAAASASAQFTLDFLVVVTENEVLSSGAGGQLASIPPGTIGHLIIETRAVPTNYPGWSTDTAKVYVINALSLNVGSLSVHGTTAFYPSISPFTGLQLANDDLVDVFQQIRTDNLSGFLAWDTPEFAFSSVVIRVDSAPGLTPELFQTTALPTSPNLLLASSRIFIIESADPGNPRVTFHIASLMGQLSPACRADVNDDGFITPADFSAWIAAFNIQAPACDQNSDAACTPADFSAWVNNYNAGC